MFNDELNNFIQTESIASVVQCIANKVAENNIIPAKTLILFDLDLTIFDRIPAIMSDLYPELRKGFLDQLLTKNPGLVKIAYAQAPYKLVESNIALQVKALREQGFIVLGFTARRTGKANQEDLTLVEEDACIWLQRLGIVFTEIPANELSIPENSLQLENYTLRPYEILGKPKIFGDIYHVSTIFTANYPKGLILEYVLDYLVSIGEDVRNVILVDDTITHLQSLKATCEKRKIPFIGMHYTFAHDHKIVLDPEVINVQQEHLINHRKLLSDIEALELMMYLKNKNLGGLENMKNIAYRYFIGRDGSEDRRQFHVLYTNTVFYYLLHSQAKLQSVTMLPYVFEQKTEHEEIDTSFVSQFEKLAILKDKIQRDISFIAIEPGEFEVPCVIYGIFSKNKLLIINPTNFSKKSSFYSALAQLQSRYGYKIFLSINKLQRDEEDLASSGPICAELALNLLQITAEECFDQLTQQADLDKGKEKYPLAFTPVDITNLLPDSLRELSKLSDEAYKQKIIAIRTSHGDSLQAVGLFQENGNSDDFWDSCVNADIQEVMHNLYANNKSILRINAMPEYQRLFKDTRSFNENDNLQQALSKIAVEDLQDDSKGLSNTKANNYFKQSNKILSIPLQFNKLQLDFPSYIAQIPKLRQLPDQSGDYYEVDVAHDGTCLFYSVVLSVLLPELNNSWEFHKLFIKLFGAENIASERNIKKLLSYYDGSQDFIERKGANLEKLIDVNFRQILIAFIKENEEFKKKLSQFLDNDELLEEYLEKLSKAKNWGGQHEIEAMSQFLERKIVVYQTKGEQFLIITKHGENFNKSIYLLHTAVTSEMNDPKIHYHYFIKSEQAEALMFPLSEAIHFPYLGEDSDQGSSHGITLPRENLPLLDSYLINGDELLAGGDLIGAAASYLELLQTAYELIPTYEYQIIGFRKLGDVYTVRGHYTNAIALYNFALASCQDEEKTKQFKNINPSSYCKEIINLMKKAEGLFLFSVTNQEIQASDYKLDQAHKDYLKNIRDEARAKLIRYEALREMINLQLPDVTDRLTMEKNIEQVLKQAELNIQQIYQKISEQLRSFVNLLIEECKNLLMTWRAPTNEYAIICFGSLARDEATPYSDLEFGVLLPEGADSEENKIYFRALTQILNIKVLNLGETTPRMQYIEELKKIGLLDRYSESPTKHGFCFDGNNKDGRKTPLGNKPFNDIAEDKKYELILTPKQMAELHNEEWFKKDRHLSTSLATAAIINCSENGVSLLKDYQAAVNRLMQQPVEQPRDQIRTVAQLRASSLLSENINQFGMRTGSFRGGSHFFSAKYDLYRLPGMILDHLALYFNSYASSLWNRVEDLLEKDILNTVGSSNLKIAMSKIEAIRLAAYLKHDCQHNYILLRDSAYPKNKQAPIAEYFQINPKELYDIYYVLVGIYAAVQNFLQEGNPILKMAMFYEDNESIELVIHMRLLDYDRAIRLGETIITQFEIQQNKDKLIKLLNTLALIYRDMGGITNLKHAKKLLEDALIEAEAFYGHEDRLVGGILFNLSSVYGSLGELQPAKNAAERALLIDENCYGKDDSRIAQSLCHLALACEDLNDIHTAKELLERAKHLSEKNNEPKHLLANILNGLAKIDGKLGDHMGKKQKLKQALQYKEEHYGAEHWHIATVLNNLSDVYMHFGHFKKAKVLSERALKIWEEYYGSDHPILISVLIELGNIYSALKYYKMRKNILERALRIFNENNDSLPLAERVFIKASILNNLGLTHRELQYHVVEKNLLEDSVSILEEYQKDHDITHESKLLMTLITVKANLATTQYEANKKISAIVTAQQALSLLQLYTSNNINPATQALQMTISSCISTWFHAAALELSQAYAISYEQATQLVQIKINAKQNYNDANAQQTLGNWFMQHNINKAIRHYKRAIELSPVNMYMSHYYLACCYRAQGAYQLAGHHLLQILQTNPNAATYLDYGFILMKLHRLDEAVEAFKQATNCVEVSGDLFACDLLAMFLLDAYRQGAITSIGQENLNIEITLLAYYWLSHSYRILNMAYHNLACCYHAQDKIEQAQDNFIRALSLRANASTYCDYGLLLFKLERLNEALEAFNSASNCVEDQCDILEYGLMEKSLLDIHLQQEITTEKDLKIAPILLAYYYLIKCHKILNQQEFLQVCLTALTEKVHERPSVIGYHLLAYVHQFLGDDDSAEESLAIASSLDNVNTQSSTLIINRNIIPLNTGTSMTQFFQPAVTPVSVNMIINPTNSLSVSIPRPG